MSLTKSTTPFVRAFCHVLQYHPYSLHFFFITHFTPAMPLFHGDSGSIDQQNSSATSIHHRHYLFNWSPTNFTSHYSIEYLSWITSISSGHNCVEHHFVLLFVKLKCTEVMSLMVKCEFDSDVHNPLYSCSGVDGVLGCFLFQSCFQYCVRIVRPI